MKDSKGPSVEQIESIPASNMEHGKNLDVNVLLVSDEGVILVPTPSSDPRDPLNLPLWQKLVLMATTCLYSTCGLASVSGLGGILGVFIPAYAAQGRTYADISNLMTFPSLFMGLGNMISMPLVLALGRRPVFLGSCVIQVVALILCGTNQGYHWHFAARCVLGLAAGQSEALCPLMVSEVFFLHERAKYQQLFSSIQTVISGTLIILTSYIAASIGWRAWYFLFAGFSGLVFLSALFFVPETKYVRTVAAYEGMGAGQDNTETSSVGGDVENPKQTGHFLTVHSVRVLDTVNFLPRTRASDMRLFVNKVDWSEAISCLKHQCQLFFFPDVAWIYIMNGIFLGINIAMGLTYGHILEESFHWGAKYISLAMAGQLVVAFICVPMLGTGSDFIVKFMARRNGGIHEPKYRLLTLPIPLILGAIFAVIYGQAAQYPDRYHWMAIVFTVNGYFFTFLGGNMSGITYMLDAYPTRGASCLVMICAMRGVISFSLSYGTVDMYTRYGYDGAFGIFGGLTAVFGVLGVVIYFTSRKIRNFIANLLVALDTTIATTALPAITYSLKSAAGYAWIGTAYSLATAVTVPVWAKVSDIWGRKPLLLAAIGIFFVGSLLCGTAKTMIWLILARALQGIGGGGISILVSICISDSFSLRERPVYFGIIGMTWAFASAIGPLLGGILTTKASWQWCFYINLPPTALSALIVVLKLKVHTPKTKFSEGIKRIDWVGSFLMIAGAVLFLLGLQMAGIDHPWDSAIILCLLIFGILLCVAFFLWEWRFAKYPLMPLRVLKGRTSISALGVCCFHSMCLVGGAYFLPLYLQGVLGASPLMSGVYLLPFTLSLSLSNIITGLCIRRTGKYMLFMRLGTIIMTLGFGLFIALPQDYRWEKIIIFQIIAGMGIGPNFQCPLIAVQASSKQGDHATAASTFNFCNNLSASVTIVISTTIFQNSMQSKHKSLIERLGAEMAGMLTGKNAAANVEAITHLPDMERTVAQRAVLRAMLGMWILYTALSAVSIACSFCAQDKVLAKEHTVTETGIEAEEVKREMEQARRKAKKEAAKEKS
ncbi:hypothetical protein VTL71DRAFT_7361 [Oculimacula yallundae]|uniref:Major facilitator superfamily (MFS) profile domain-containing protein n=1 Tax=Oculimacula yallundae TaxID=86028 RepID=A0ABR4BWJ3_9HELO